MKSEFIIDVNEPDFEYEVLAYSSNKPVVVDFWATWCAPCRVLGPILEKLALEFQGSFRLAKVDVDQNQNLATRYNVRSIPSVKAFSEGKVVTEFTGALPEARIREILINIAPSQDTLQLEKGKSLLNDRNGKEAEALFRKLYEKNPFQPAVLLGLIKSLLLQGRGQDCLAYYSAFPASRELASAEILKILAVTYAEFDFLPTNHSDPLDASYLNALRLAKRGNLEAAMDGLLDILRQDKNYKNGDAKKTFLGLLELLGEQNPESRSYRSELASVLF